jgi:hypothetical protein
MTPQDPKNIEIDQQIGGKSQYSEPSDAHGGEISTLSTTPGPIGSISVDRTDFCRNL